MKNQPLDPNNWSMLLNCFTDGIYLTRPDGLTIAINKAYEKITGVKASQVVGRYMQDIVSDGTLSSTITKEVLNSRKEITAEQNSKSGQRFVISGKPILDDKGQIVFVLTIVRDMAAIDSLQKEIASFRELAEKYKTKLEAIEHSPKFVAKSDSFKNAVDLAHRVANIDSTVLIMGESGTGKEIIAREIHENSHRVSHNFIKVNCGAIPENLLESELFGYEKGAFTGASPSGHKGVFEMANNGTIFLDEIGDMPLILQVKLLRVLQEKVITKIGSTKPITVNTRIIAATNENLEDMVKEKKFRNDLFYRLNVVRIHTPPLRERKDEIPTLINFFMNNINIKYNLNKKIHPDLVKELMDYDWPGNVRELENAIERMMVTSESDYLKKDNTELYFNRENAKDEGSFTISGIMPLETACDNLEEFLIKEAKKRYKTTYQIAEALGISQPSVSRKMKKFM